MAKAPQVSIAISNQFAIEKNVPIPKNNQGGPIYPLAEMEVGDSFFVPPGSIGRTGTPANKQRLRSASCQFGKKRGLKFRVRDEGHGWRVWRTA